MTEQTEQKRCARNVYHTGMFRSTPCAAKPVVFEDGHWWCRQHSPSYKKTQSEKRDKQYNAERDWRGALSTAKRNLQQSVDKAVILIHYMAVDRADPIRGYNDAEDISNDIKRFSADVDRLIERGGREGYKP